MTIVTGMPAVLLQKPQCDWTEEEWRIMAEHQKQISKPALDLTRPIQTRNGRPVRILTTDAKYRSNDVLQPIIAVIDDSFVGFWSIDGKFNENANGVPSDYDLVNVRPKKVTVTVCVRLYRMHLPKELYAAVAIEGQSTAWGDDFVAQKFIEMEYEDKSP